MSHAKQGADASLDQQAFQRLEHAGIEVDWSVIEEVSQGRNLDRKVTILDHDLGSDGCENVIFGNEATCAINQ